MPAHNVRHQIHVPTHFVHIDIESRSEFKQSLLFGLFKIIILFEHQFFDAFRSKRLVKIKFNLVIFFLKANILRKFHLHLFSGRKHRNNFYDWILIIMLPHRKIIIAVIVFKRCLEGIQRVQRAVNTYNLDRL